MTVTLTPASASAPNVVPRGSLGRGLSGILTTCVGGLGVWLGLLGLFGSARSLHIGWLLPLSGVWLDLDPLGGFFITATGAVAIPIGVYLIGYRHHLARVPLAVLPLFVAAMLLVPAAGSVTTFLLAWELMAVASLVLVLAEHTRAEVRSAGRFYAVMTQLGFVAVLIGLMVLYRGRWRGSVRRPDAGTRWSTHRHLRVDGGRVRVEGWAGAAARVVAACASGGAEPGVGADERRDGQPGHLRHRAL